MMLPVLFLLISLATMLDWVSLDRLDHVHRCRRAVGVAHRGIVGEGCR